MKRIFITTILLLLSALSPAIAQPAYPPPSGLYCSCGPTTGMGYGSVAPNIATIPFVNGILVRIGWELLEPMEGEYDWSLLDGQIAAANAYGKKVSLGIGNGGATPQWLFDAGAERLTFSLPVSDTLAVPWDEVYLAKWTRFIAQLGTRYNQDTTVTLVYMTHSTANGYEMQLPRSTAPTLAEVGYSDSRMIASWKSVIDAFADAFPNHYLTNDFHPVNGSNAVADSVYEYASGKLSGRYGASAWWWSQNNAENVYSEQYELMKHSAQNDAFTGIQMVKSGAVDSSAFGEGGMPAALRKAMDDNICYWEVWNQDLLAESFHDLLDTASCVPAVQSVPAVPATSELQVYPNPSTGSVVVTMPTIGWQRYLTIFNMYGQAVAKYSFNEQGASLVLSHLPNGVYFFVCGDARQMVTLFR